jgi:hypothetical protein
VLPNFLIVGAPKSGTTSLARYLADHPDAWVVPEKELRFFDQHYDLGRDWYRDRFAAAGSEQAIGEATPTYLINARAPARIAETLPDVRLIAILRNPVDRAYSHYWHWRERLGETRSFEQVVEDELAGKANGSDPIWRPEAPETFPYLGYGRYAPQLENLARHFPPERILVLLFEDLTERPAEVFGEVCRFLGIDDSAVPESVGRVENAFRYYYPRWLWALFVRVKIGRFLPGRAAAALYRAMVREADPYPPMDPALRERLTEHFAPDNAALERRLGRDLSRWQPQGASVSA